MYHRHLRQTIRFSRGLILGRLLTGIRHGLTGLTALALVSLTLTGYVQAAILLVCVLYLVGKAIDTLIGRGA